jgi:hypothetical protein
MLVCYSVSGQIAHLTMIKYSEKTPTTPRPVKLCLRGDPIGIHQGLHGSNIYLTANAVVWRTQSKQSSLFEAVYIRPHQILH